MTYTLEVCSLAKTFGGAPALVDVSFRAAPGSVLCLLGPNGAGKTTTVRILATLVRPDSGTARVAGADVVRDAWRARAAISLTGQSVTVDERLTGRENLLMTARLRRLGRRDARGRAAELLDRFDLGAAGDRRVATYSGGMRRRLDIALGLVGHPSVLLLDEPTTGLDPRSRRETWDLVEDLAASGVTVLLTTQQLEEAGRLADHVVVVDQGRVVAEGTPGQLADRVGGATLRLVAAHTAALAAAAQSLTAGGHPPSRVDGQERTVHVPTDGSPAGIGHVLGLVAAGDVPIERVDLHRPSLDDAFLALTGSGSLATPTASVR